MREIRFGRDRAPDPMGSSQRSPILPIYLGEGTPLRTHHPALWRLILGTFGAAPE